MSASGNSTEPDAEPEPEPEPAAARGGRTRPGNAPEPEVWSDTAVGRGKGWKSRQLGPDRYCSPRHRMSFDINSEGSTCVSITQRTIGRAYIARHVMGCHGTQESRVQIACKVVLAGNINQAIPAAGAPEADTRASVVPSLWSGTSECSSRMNQFIQHHRKSSEI
jgi:hypothetical protein